MTLRVFVLLMLLAGLPMTAGAVDRAAVERQYQDWLEQAVWPRAKAEGVSRGTFEAAFRGVTLDWNLPDLVPPGSE
ncbi:MAG: lytic murein transglycosylase, partial [Roseovarius sp.]